MNHRQRTYSSWFKQARRDLKAARDSMAAENYEWASFQSQQAAEKALKGYIYYQGQEPQKVHSASAICSQAEKLDPAFAEIHPLAVELDRHYMDARYPDVTATGIPAENYNGADAQGAVSLAEQVIRYVSGKYGASS